MKVIGIICAGVALSLASAAAGAQRQEVGPFDSPNVNGICYANSYPGADIFAQVNAAYVACGAGMVKIRPGTYNAVTTTAVLNSAADSLQCDGPQGATVINYTGTGDAIRWQFFGGGGAYTVQKGGTLRGCTINGTAAGRSGLHMGDFGGAFIENNSIFGFTAGSGIWIDNTTYWTENTTFMGNSLGGNSIDIRLTVNGGTISFARTNFLATEIDMLAATEVAMSVENAAFIYDGTIELQGNMNVTGGTILKLATATDISQEQFQIGIECTNGCTSGTSVLALGTAALQRSTGMINGENMTNNIAGTANIFLSKNNYYSGEPFGLDLDNATKFQASQSSQPVTGVGTWILPNSSAFPGSSGGWSDNIGWNGANLFTATDGTSNGGAMELCQYNSGICTFYAVPTNTPGAGQNLGTSIAAYAIATWGTGGLTLLNANPTTVGVAFNMQEGTTTGGVGGYDQLVAGNGSALYPHRWIMNLNNTGLLAVVGSGINVAGRIKAVASNGIDDADSGVGISAGAGAPGGCSNQAIYMNTTGTAGANNLGYLCDHGTPAPLITTAAAGGAPPCADTSGSPTAQSCTTSPSFTPVGNSCIAYSTTTANTGAGLTINVNSLGAKSVAKWLGSTTLIAGDMPANKSVLVCYDGTIWNMQSIGNVPSSVGGGVQTVTLASGVATYNSLAAATVDNLTATANVTSSVCPTGATSGATYTFNFIQNSTGGWTNVWPTCFVGFPSTVAPDATATTTCTAQFNGTNFIQPTCSNNSGHGVSTCTTAPGSTPAAGTAFPYTSSLDNCTPEAALPAGGTAAMVLKGGDVNPLTGNIGGIAGVPFCTGYSPANGSNLQYTTGGSPNPCWTTSSSFAGPTFNAFAYAFSGSSTSSVVTNAATVNSGNISIASGDLVVSYAEGNTPQTLTASSSPSVTYSTVTPSTQTAAPFGQLSYGAAPSTSSAANFTTTSSAAETGNGNLTLDFTCATCGTPVSVVCTQASGLTLTCSGLTVTAGAHGVLGVFCASEGNQAKVWTAGTINGTAATALKASSGTAATGSEACEYLAQAGSYSGASATITVNSGVVTTGTFTGWPY